MVDQTGTPASWQSILGRIAKTPQERQQLASDLGVSIITLNRWISGESRPQRPHLIRLLQVINQQHRAELVDALKQDFPDIESWLKDKAPRIHRTSRYIGLFGGEIPEVGLQGHSNPWSDEVRRLGNARNPFVCRERLQGS